MGPTFGSPMMTSWRNVHCITSLCTVCPGLHRLQYWTCHLWHISERLLPENREFNNCGTRCSWAFHGIWFHAFVEALGKAAVSKLAQVIISRSSVGYQAPKLIWLWCPSSVFDWLTESWKSDLFCSQDTIEVSKKGIQFLLFSVFYFFFSSKLNRNWTK